MGITLNLLVDVEGGEQGLTYEVRGMINAGRTNRDISETKKHLEELRKAGANLSDEIPVVHPKLADRITTGDKVNVLPGSKTSGEVEYVILIHENNIFITIGSDHTDRELQQYNSCVSKQIYPNVMSPILWKFDDVKDHWDDLVMRSWVENNGKRELYQEGRLVEMMRPEEIIELVRSRLGTDLNGFLIFPGTFPTIGGELCYSQSFEMELLDEVRGKSIRHNYAVEEINWLKNQAD